jgi:hypothetical protein
MEQISHYCMYRPGKRCSVGLYAGDISSGTRDWKADLLIVSAFKHDYSPTKTSVIGSLHRAGVNFGELQVSSVRINQDCWLSPRLPAEVADRIGAERILCYEGGHNNPVESLQMMFSALLQAGVDGRLKLRALKMPILCAGDQLGDPLHMLREILLATAVSFESGIAVEEVRIVVLPDRACRYAKTFDAVRSEYDPFSSERDPQIEHDLFISYCHHDKKIVESVHQHLESEFGKDIRLFRDEAGGLNPGDVIPYKLAHGIRASRCMAAFYSGSYVNSGACNMEFGLAYARRARVPDKFQLRPILIGKPEDIVGPFTNVVWEDASGNAARACEKAAGIARTIIGNRSTVDS